ncbi:MAG: cell division protein ZapA [Ruminococcus sp.]|nr:cell division protein ZapA [Ruminococcus sp.]
MSDRNQVTVNIYGRSYTMLTDEPAGQTEKIAAALNERMKRLREQKSSLSLQDAAAIISLECMEQLINTKQAEQNIRTQISAYAEEAEYSRGESEKLKKEVERLKERVRQLEQERELRGSFAAEETTAEQIVNAGISRALGAPPKASAVAGLVQQPVPVPSPEPIPSRNPVPPQNPIRGQGQGQGQIQGQGGNQRR